MHLEVYILFKGNFADARISFLIKARQQHRELRSLPVTENCAVSSYLRFCVCASGTFVFIVINLGVCVCVFFFSVGVGKVGYFQQNVSLSLHCSFVILLLVPFLLYIVFERSTTKSLQ